MSTKYIFFFVPAILVSSEVHAKEGEALDSERHIVVDLKNFRWEAFEGGELVREGLASGGRRFCPDIKRKCRTPNGTFFVLSKKGRFYRSPLYPLGCSNKKGSKNLCASMAYAIKFHSDGASLHASESDNWLKPKHISYSCVHMQLKDIRWINEEFIDDKTKIIILDY